MLGGSASSGLVAFLALARICHDFIEASKLKRERQAIQRLRLGGGWWMVGGGEFQGARFASRRLASNLWPGWIDSWVGKSEELEAPQLEAPQRWGWA